MDGWMDGWMDGAASVTGDLSGQKGVLCNSSWSCSLQVIFVSFCEVHLSPSCKETTLPGGEQAAAPEMDLQLAAEATWIQSEQTPANYN